MKVRRYVLGPRKPEVHAVVGLHTLCGLSLAFASDPREVTDEVTCEACSQVDALSGKSEAA